MSLRRSYVDNIAYYFITIFFSQGSTFLIGIILANIFEVNDFGKYSFLLIFINTAISISGVGLTSVSNRFIAEYKGLGREKITELFNYFTRILFYTNGPLILIFLILGPHLSLQVLGIHVSITLWIVFSLILFFGSFNSFFLGVHQGLIEYKGLSFASVIYGIMYVSLIIIFSRIYGINGVFLGIMLSGLIYFMILINTIRKYIDLANFSVRISASERSDILRFIIPNFFIGLFAMPSILLAQKFLVMNTNSYEGIAYFNVAFTLIGVAAIIPGLVNTVLSSYLFSHINHESIFNKIFRNGKAGLILIVLVELIFLVALGKYVLLIYGKDYSAAYLILIILSVGLIFDSFTMIYSNVIYARNEMWRNFLYITLPRDLLLVLLAFYLTLWYGATGLALAFVISKALGSTSSFFLYKSITRKPHDK